MSDDQPQAEGQIALIEPPKPRRRRKPTVAVAPKPAVEAPLTVEKRLALTKLKARELAREQKIRIALRLGVSLEMHEALVAIAERSSGAKIPDVAIRCMEIGIGQLLPNSVRAAPTAIRAAGPYADTADERERARQAMEAVVSESDEVERARDELAKTLHLPGRRAATG